MITFRRRYLLLLLLPFIYFLPYNKTSIQKNEPYKTEKVQLKGMQPGYLFSVAVDNRNHYIAKKVSKNLYQLEFVSPYEPIKVGQEVRTTGLDRQFPEDILVGYITKIQHDKNSIYAMVFIKPERPHHYPNQE